MNKEQLLVKLANNSSLIRGYLGVPDWKNIVKITSNSVHRLIGFKNGLPEIEARIVCQKFSNIELIEDVARLMQPHEYKQSLNSRFGLTSVYKAPIVSYYNAPSLTMATTGDLSANVTGRITNDVTNQTWLSIHDDATGSGADNSFLRPNLAAHTTTDRWKEIHRGGVEWDSSSITDGATIDSGTVQLDAASATDDATLNQGINFCSFAPASDTYATGDFDAFGSTDFATAIDIGSISIGSYTTWTLNAAGLAAVSDTGDTKFGVRMTGDLTDTEPTWGNSISSVVTFDDTGDTNKPLLTIIYTVASVNHINLMLMGVG